jgi:hypothetical protein
MRPRRPSASERWGRPRPVSGARRATPRLAIVVQGGVVQGIYAQRCGPLTVYLLDDDDLRADDGLATEVARTGEVPSCGHPAAMPRQAPCCAGFILTGQRIDRIPGAQRRHQA